MSAKWSGNVKEVLACHQRTAHTRAATLGPDFVSISKRNGKSGASVRGANARKMKLQTKRMKIKSCEIPFRSESAEILRSEKICCSSTACTRCSSCGSRQSETGHSIRPFIPVRRAPKFKISAKPLSHQNGARRKRSEALGARQRPAKSRPIKMSEK